LRQQCMSAEKPEAGSRCGTAIRKTERLTASQITVIDDRGKGSRRRSGEVTVPGPVSIQGSKA